MHLVPLYMAIHLAAVVSRPSEDTLFEPVRRQNGLSGWSASYSHNVLCFSEVYKHIRLLTVLLSKIDPD